MALWGRLMHTLNQARQAYMSYGASADLLAMDSRTWDTAGTRFNRYRIYDAFYNNTAYFDPVLLTQLQTMKPKWYRNIRGVYNPVNRFVTLYQSKIYGGALDMQGLIDGAIPIEQADDRLREAIIQVWRWSHWQANKSVYVQFGAKFGDVLLKVVDDTQRQRVRIEVLDPRKVTELRCDDTGAIEYVCVEYERMDDTTGHAYTYAEEITPEAFKTYRDGQPHAYFTDEDGTGLKEWQNEYGFVPMVLCQHAATGLTWGQNGYHAVLDKISEVNDQASLLNDQVRKVINPVWAITGAQSKGVDLETNRDNIPTLHLPPNATIQPMIAPIDITSAAANIQNLLLELERDMPELSLYRLREQASVTAPGIKAAYSDAVGRIQESRGQYDAAQETALKMAIAIGGYRRYEGFTAYGLDDYENDNLDFFIGNRPVVPDELSTTERIGVLERLGGTKKLVLQALGYPDDVIAEVLDGDEQRARAEVQSLTQGIFGADEDEEDDDIEDDVEAEADDDETTP